MIIWTVSCRCLLLNYGKFFGLIGEPRCVLYRRRFQSGGDEYINIMAIQDGWKDLWVIFFCMLSYLDVFLVVTCLFVIPMIKNTAMDRS